jgi:hypothetical protein
MANPVSRSEPTAIGGNVNVNTPGVVVAIVFGVVAVFAVIAIAISRRKEK